MYPLFSSLNGVELEGKQKVLALNNNNSYIPKYVARNRNSTKFIFLAYNIDKNSESFLGCESVQQGIILDVAENSLSGKQNSVSRYKRFQNNCTLHGRSDLWFAITVK
jgi:hypothetical protein